MTTKTKHKFDERRIGALVKRQDTIEEPLSADPVALLVHSALCENSSRHAADQALQRIRDRTVDLNEYRVCLPTEAAAILGARTPKAIDRAITIRRMLYDIFRRNHGLHLAHLQGANKRDIRASLEALDGATPFIAARVALLAYDVHVMPVDDSICAALVAAGHVDEGMPAGDVASHLERLFKGEAIRGAHLALQAWSDAEGAALSKSSKAKPKAVRATKSAASKKSAPAAGKAGKKR